MPGRQGKPAAVVVAGVDPQGPPEVAEVASCLSASLGYAVRPGAPSCPADFVFAGARAPKFVLCSARSQPAAAAAARCLAASSLAGLAVVAVAGPDCLPPFAELNALVAPECGELLVAESAESAARVMDAVAGAARQGPRKRDAGVAPGAAAAEALGAQAGREVAGAVCERGWSLQDLATASQAVLETSLGPDVAQCVARFLQ
eukprot:m51a1_g7549 hypothetical protein (203) ;mRNA; r:85464-86072